MRNTLQKARIVALLAAPLALSACGKTDDKAGKGNPGQTGTTGNTTTDPSQSSTTTPASDKGPCFTKPANTLRLFDDTSLARDQAKVEELLRERTPEGFLVTVSAAYRNATGADASHFELTQSFGGIPFCGFKAKAHVIGDEAQVPFFASYTAPASVGEAAFGTPEAAAQNAANSMNLAGAKIAVHSNDRCLQPVGNELVPAFDMMVTIGNAPYRVIGNATGAFMVESQSLHATATAAIYKRNITEGKTTDTTIDVADDGALNSATLRVVDPDGAVIGPKADGGKIAAEVGSAAFQEVSLFAHVQEQFAYDLQFRSLSDTDCMPIEIQAHAGPDDGPVYLPSWNQTTGHPRIVVPDAIPGVLANLSTDYDAVAHETNHHFVYQRLKSLHDPSRIIHEGLADYFVFAHTGDNCLAESICPKDSASELCVVHGQCLRSGDVTVSNMKFYNDDYNAAPYHKKGQAISGLLIAIGKEPDVGADVIAKIMFSGIDFLSETAGIAEWLEAVLQGYKASYKGAHCETIVKKAKEFGLTSETASIDCSKYK
jgi:hypothetical protein